MRSPWSVLAFLAFVTSSACSSASAPPAPEATDAASADAAPLDAGGLDAAAADAGEPDAVPEDAAAPDAEAPDTGPPICPVGAGAGCAQAADCSAPLAPPTNCPACVPYTRSLCAAGACVSPPLLEAGDVHNVIFMVPSSVPMVQSFVGYAVAKRTAGGAELSCAEIYADQLAMSDPCLNVLDTRAITGIAQAGTTYTMSFTRFASGQAVLFVVVGYSEEGTSGTRQGVSCTEAVVGAPGRGRVDLAGDPMRRFP